MPILTPQSDFVRADSSSWQHQIRTAIRSVDELLKRLKLPANQLENGPIAATKDFPVFVPLPYLDRIRPGDMDDPLLVQVLPVPAEDFSPDSYSNDPLDELKAIRQAGMLQKYAGRGFAGDDWGLRNQLPLLLPATLSLRKKPPNHLFSGGKQLVK